MWLRWICALSTAAVAFTTSADAAVVVSTVDTASNVTYSLTEDPVAQEGFCDTTKQLSGYFKIDGSKSKNYFYWFFESRHDPANDPVMIWLTGGPGCSSMLALLGENGPCSVQSDGKTLQRNPYSWNERANIMWIDQPIGVGFSYGDKSEYDTNEAMVGNDMYAFLQAFFQAHPEYVKLPFYVFGESYGGHYVPAVAHRIFVGNKKHEQEGKIKIALAGFGIGNGLTDPQVQYEYYPEMAYNNTYNVKAVSKSVYLAMKAAVPVCTKMIAACQSTKAACLAAQAFCNAALVAPYSASGLNVYDVREKCAHFPMCYDFSNIETFLRLPSTLEKLHVSSKSSKWQSCNMAVHAAFAYDWMKNFHQLVVPMLEGGIRGLVYAGDADFIVNWMGCKAWTLALEWKHQQAFVAAEDKDWIVDNVKTGRIRSADTFTFVQVFNAGHMVPFNQPKNSLKLVNEFIAKQEEPMAIKKEETEVVATM